MGLGQVAELQLLLRILSTLPLTLALLCSARLFLQVLDDHGGPFLPDHDARRVRVGPHQLGHDGSINHSESADAVNPETVVDDGALVLGEGAYRTSAMGRGKGYPKLILRMEEVA